MPDSSATAALAGAPLRSPARTLLFGFLALLVWAFLFQGTRGLFEPDEGFYTHAALNMVESGDWLVPRLDNGPFLDKPPLSLWSMAAGLRLLGTNEWGARAAHAVWFALTALLVGAIAAHLLQPGARWAASAAYAVMPLPFVAANVVTPDTPLAFWSALAVFAYLRSRTDGGRWRFALLCGLAVAGGTLTKGPAMWMLAAPIAIDRLCEGRRRPWMPDVAASAVALLGLAWYVAVARRIPGAAAYFLDNQVTGRLVTSAYERHAGLLGALIYVPVLLVGCLPFSLTWWRDLRTAWRDRFWRGLIHRPAARFVVLWLGLPLAVLLAAQSRLPLYVLPLCAPLAVLAVRPDRSGLLAVPWSQRARLGLLAWAVVLLGVKAGGAYWPLPQDSRVLARALAAVEPDPTTPIVLLEVKRNGLALYGWRDLRPAVLLRNAYPFFTPAVRFDNLLRSVADRHLVVVTGDGNLASAEGILRAARRSCRATDGPFHYVFLSCEPRADG